MRQPVIVWVSAASFALVHTFVFELAPDMYGKTPVYME